MNTVEASVREALEQASDKSREDKPAKDEPAKLSDLSEEQKEALRQELLKDLQGGSDPAPKEEAPVEEDK